MFLSDFPFEATFADETSLVGAGAIVIAAAEEFERVRMLELGLSTSAAASADALSSATAATAASRWTVSEGALQAAREPGLLAAREQEGAQVVA